MKEKYSDMESRLKRKDAELSHLKENHKHLLQLSQDKQLVDREKLTKRVEHLESKEKELNEKIQVCINPFLPFVCISFLNPC